MSFSRGLKMAGFARGYLTRMRKGRRAVMEHLASPRPESLPMPTFVQLRVTNLCNLRCKMCGQWGDTGIYRSDGFPASATDGEHERRRIQELLGLKRQLSLSDYVRLLDEIAPWQPIISLFGGKPFLYPDILPLIGQIKERGLICTVITNGGRLERHARDLVESGIDSIAVSIDGPPEVHNRIRGKDDSFQKAAAGVRAVAFWRKKLRRALPMQIAILPVTELNMDASSARPSGAPTRARGRAGTRSSAAPYGQAETYELLHDQVDLGGRDFSLPTKCSGIGDVHPRSVTRARFS